MTTAWKRPTCSDAACVEVLDDHNPAHAVLIRSQFGQLAIARDEWTVFINAVKDGEFDLPGSVSAQ